MDAAEFRASLARLETSARRFAASVGSNERTVRRWASGEQDIPPWVPAYLGLVEHFANTRGGTLFATMRQARSAFLAAYGEWIVGVALPREGALSEMFIIQEDMREIVRSKYPKGAVCDGD